TPFRSLPSTTMSRPGRKRSGTEPVYRTGTAAVPFTSRRRKWRPAPWASPETGFSTFPESETLPVWPARELGRSEGVPPPATDEESRNTARTAATESAMTSRAGLRLRATGGILVRLISRGRRLGSRNGRSSQTRGKGAHGGNRLFPPCFPPHPVAPQNRKKRN